MNFEGPRSTEKEGVEDEQKKIESIFGKSLKCFKKWSRLGIAVGAVFVIGEIAKMAKKEVVKYDTYITSTLSSEQLIEKEKNKEEIKNIFGERAVTDIYEGDLIAFSERESKDRVEPNLEGFTEKQWDNEKKYRFTEKYLWYPKGWINGEIDQIKFIDILKVQSINGGQNIVSGKFGKEVRGGNTVYFYRNNSIKQKNEYLPVSASAEAHEIGHANDWETDMDLNILERQELLLQLHQRLIATDSYHRDNSSYHENFLDGTKEGLYKAAREYWADICGEYFGDQPEVFFKKHPEDFKLVDNYAKKNDPSFNVFNPNRGAFDQQTGELKDVWKGK
jgi:hypothetical protein